MGRPQRPQCGPRGRTGPDGTQSCLVQTPRRGVCAGTWAPMLVGPGVLGKDRPGPQFPQPLGDKVSDGNKLGDQAGALDSWSGLCSFPPQGLRSLRPTASPPCRDPPPSLPADHPLVVDPTRGSSPTADQLGPPLHSGNRGPLGKQSPPPLQPANLWLSGPSSPHAPPAHLLKASGEPFPLEVGLGGSDCPQGSDLSPRGRSHCSLELWRRIQERGSLWGWM